jgi:Zn-dependent peptidase ImmA (M78 family)/transcriptional regulator with XRE-family HTH domain
MIYGERIKQVREYMGWTQQDLAAQLLVRQPFIANMESGVAKAPLDTVTTLAFKTGFPLSFFESPAESNDFPLGSLLFRAHADMKDREQRVVHRHAQMAFEIVRHLLASRLIRPVPIKVPRVLERDPEHAATMARSELGLSNDSPVKHVISTMESAGVVVIAIPRAFARGDAFSAWVFADDIGQRRPVVVLSADRPADRVRMNACHELAHLVMHQQVAASTAALEDDAKKFASAFLLPADAMREIIVPPVTLDTFVQLKPYWGVSIQALIVRAHSLGLITPRKYKTLMQRLSARGWRLNEPLSSQVPLERPRVVRQMAEAIYGQRINYVQLASETHYPESFVRDLLEAHASKSPGQPMKADTESGTTNSVLPFGKIER